VNKEGSLSSPHSILWQSQPDPNQGLLCCGWKKHNKNPNNQIAYSTIHMPLLNTKIRRFGFEASDKYQHFWDKEDAATAAILQYIFLDLGLEFCLV
jgi:hypothetical protein